MYMLLSPSYLAVHKHGVAGGEKRLTNLLYRLFIIYAAGCLDSLIIPKTLIHLYVHAASTVLFYVHASNEVVALSPMQSNCLR
jgi:hypothetical protein